jgi:hypothetical protein
VYNKWFQSVRLDYVSVFAMCVRAFPTHASLNGLSILCDRSKYITTDNKDKSSATDDEDDDNDFFAQVRIALWLLY